MKHIKDIKAFDPTYFEVGEAYVIHYKNIIAKTVGILSGYYFDSLVFTNKSGNTISVSLDEYVEGSIDIFHLVPDEAKGENK